MAKIFVATGNTFKAGTYLKEAGFTFNAEKKQWQAADYNRETWAKLCRATYSRVSATICQSITITEQEAS